MAEMFKGVGLAADPAIRTQLEARTISQISLTEWLIVARNPRKYDDSHWHWCMDDAEVSRFRALVDDKSLVTVQRRDADFTVLLAKWAKTE